MGLLAERVFGYMPPTTISATSGGAARGDGPANARALAAAMLSVTPLPWFVCIYFFGLLGRTYEHDRRSAQATDEAYTKLST